MSFSIGIVGLPNVGKSTLFQALTKKQVDVSNYPFATIDPNVGVVAVPDQRLDKIAQITNSAKAMPTTIEFLDIAGLVKGAHKGEGLGNQFLSHIREVKAIAHVIRTFSDPDVVHVAGQSEPQNDIDTINIELLMADLKTVQNKLAEVVPKANSGEKEMQALLPVLEKVEAGFNQGQLTRQLGLSDDELLQINDLNLLTLKPTIYVLNVGEEYFKDLSKASVPDSIAGQPTVPISAKIEAELSELDEADAQEYLKDLHLEKTGLERLITTSYQALDLITFFSANPKEAHAWTVKRDTLIPEAAGVIHTDFQTGFIRADVINWQQLISAGSEQAAKEKGLIATEGKDYVVQDGDVIFIHAN
ncbi:redox-regulated ATPase YchF [Patescibacteria group bacterium]